MMTFDDLELRERNLMAERARIDAELAKVRAEYRARLDAFERQRARSIGAQLGDADE